MAEREILFRGKRTYNGKWVEGSLVVTSQCNAYIISTVEDKRKATVLVNQCSLNVDPETVGQYTGLTDKNGRKIFEGDIVRYGDTIHKVVFEQRNDTAYFGLVYSEVETMPFGHYQDLTQIEVIGNIHDNPEILKNSSP